MKPLAIDLYAGLGGWSDGLLAEGYSVIGFDNERHVYGEAKYPAQLVLQDVLTLHGSQFKDAALIVGSSPCQEFSYRAMPWKRAKALPPPYLGIALFEAQFRIQREACEAARHHIPLVVENVCGAQKWVGKAKWHYGSFYLWGDVPALMHTTTRRKISGRIYQRDGEGHTRHLTNPSEHTGIKVPGNKLSENGFAIPVARQIDKSLKPEEFSLNSKDRRQHLSYSRKAASAHIAKIPLPLAQWIGRAWKPDQEAIA